jgi:tetratricopeptide (TPR) repeat protein
LREEPGDPEAVCGLAGAVLARRAPQEALDLVIQARRIHPNHAGLLAMQSAAYRGLSRFDEALVCIDTAIALAPRDPNHRLARVHLLMALNRAVDAVAEVEAGLALAGSMPELLNAKGILSTRTGRKHAGVAAFRAAFDNDPGCAEYAHNLAVALSELGYHRDALRFAERAYLNEPGETSYRLGLARCFIALGRLAEAQEMLQAARVLGPQDVAATDMLSAKLRCYIVDIIDICFTENCLSLPISLPDARDRAINRHQPRYFIPELI